MCEVVILAATNSFVIDEIYLAREVSCKHSALPFTDLLISNLEEPL
jgi:hypothetical protein